MSSPQRRLAVPGQLRRTGHTDQQNWMQSAHELLALVAEVAGRSDLAETSILDVGCGTKFTKAILDGDLPVGRYVGMDVSADVIDHLRTSVSDPRFEYHHLDAHNARYNPGGRSLADIGQLSLGDESFDIVTLFSVFTHLAPHDYSPMLRLLRPHIRSEGRLVYSIYLNEEADDGEGLVTAIARAIEADPSLLAGTTVPPEPPDFVDLDPDDVLKHAVYSRRYALELVEGTGWRVEDIRDPEWFVQHQFICRPVAP